MGNAARKRIFGGLVGLLMLTGTTVAPGTASAAAANCLGHTLHSASRVTQGTAIYGSIQLCRNGTYWFGMYFSGPSQHTMPAGHHGYAQLWSYVDGHISQDWACSTPGGSGQVNPGAPGGSSCVTPMINSHSTHVTFVALGKEIDSTGALFAGGRTLRCNVFAGCV